MNGIEISRTDLEHRITTPFLQREMDPFVRFEKGLGLDNTPRASFYCMSSKAGSFTPGNIDAAGEAHWLAVVKGIKWLYLLPPTEHNLKMWKAAEEGSIRADFLWLPDLCAETPVQKQVVGENQAVLIPSGYLPAVYTVTDSPAFAGRWLHEYNMDSHLKLEKIEIVTKSLKANRFPQFDRICWLFADDYPKKWWKKRAQPKSSRFLHQIEELSLKISAEMTKIKNKEPGWRTAERNLPSGWKTFRTWTS
ncbi:hypothetical protein QFC20_005021 [Naganishia adeliensis]|uniref:Uncharacterized protein n=1 Tax=Naganishia adeliensis TaxID=92952 RepID=A0ACC2VSN5_9TREE|nr:hypothetical protein QFC20_005021 [Naganishia adeliensis]